MRKFSALQKFLKDDKGASMAEYAVLMAVMTLAVVVALQALGTSVAGVLTRTATFLNTITPGT